MRARRVGDRGSATVEFAGVAVLALVPLIYVVIALFDVQRQVFAATHAAREAGRALETASDLATGYDRAERAVDLAFEDHGLPMGGVRLALAASPGGCAAAPPFDPRAARVLDGSTLCVVAPMSFPGVPGIVTGTNNTVTGAYVVHLNPFGGAGP